MKSSARLFDSSVWVALAFGSHPHHSEALMAFEAADSDSPAAFCRATQQTFLRLVTTPTVQKLFGSAVITNDEAWEKWVQIAKLPQVIWLDEPKGMATLWQRYACVHSASPKVWMDAYLAGFAQGHGVAFVTLDKDFRNFDGLNLECLVLPVSAPEGLRGDTGGK
jgi:toxin-antitoxin system PIN domain toxin